MLLNYNIALADSIELKNIQFQAPHRFLPPNFEINELIQVYNTSDAVGIFFCGAIALLTFFIFLLYIKNKEKIYLYYVLFLFFMLLYGSIHIEASSWFTGSLHKYINKNKRLVEPVTILSFSFYILFSLELLNIKLKDSKLHRYLYIWAVCNITYSIFYYILYDLIFPFEHYVFLTMRAFIFPLSLYYLIWIAKKIKSEVKPYFIYGSLAYFIGAILATTRYSVDDIWFKPFYYLTAPVYFELAILIETLFFALALGDRIYLLHIEKQRASEKLIQQLSINQEITRVRNKELINVVNEKIDEVSQINSQLREQEKIRIQAEFEKNIAQAEMLARRLQINPHFLFNSLNAIKYLIQSGKSDRAIKYLVIFSRFMRKVLDTSLKNVISLDLEFQIIKDFLDLEKNRFGHEFNYRIHTKDKDLLRQVMVPPLLLQPFVENAIWHGLLPSEESKKKLNITVYSNESGQVIINIDDNGIGRLMAQKLSKAKLHKSMGISLTDERIKLYNNSYSTNLSYQIIDKSDTEGRPTGTRIQFILKSEKQTRL